MSWCASKLAMTTQNPNNEIQLHRRVRMLTLIGADKKGLWPAEEEDMIESRVGANTPKLDQLKTDIVLGLQELQDQVAKHGSMWNFAYESRLRWERDIDGYSYSYQIEWSPLDGKVSFASGDAERQEGCIFLGYWSPGARESLSIWPGARGPLDQTIQDWTNVVLGQIDARTMINLLHCDMIPSDIELDGFGLCLMDLLLWIHQLGGSTYSSRFGLNHTAFVPVVETILSYYLLEAGAEITDCKAVHDIAEWLSVVRNQGPGTQRFLELVAQL